MAAPHLAEGAEQVVTADAEAIGHGQQQVLGGQVLVVQLDPPDSGNAWFLSVLGPGVEGHLLPIEAAIADGKATKPLQDELLRLERILPVLLRPGAQRRGQVYLSQDEAWELMTVTGAGL